MKGLKTMTTEEMVTYDIIVNMGIATSEELNLAFNMTAMGWKDTLDRVVYIRTGYNSIEDYMAAEDGE